MGEVTVGVDWGSSEHAVHVVRPSANGTENLDERGWRVPHTPDGLQKLIAVLRGLAARPEEVAVGTERPDGVLAECLVDAGFSLFSINPLQVDRFRDRFSVAGAKDDALDARVIARSLRTDRDLFSPVSRLSPEETELRALSRLQQRLTQATVRISNQIGVCLSRYFPQFLELETGFNRSVWALELLEVVPSPQALEDVTDERLANIIRRTAYEVSDIRRILGGEQFGISTATTEAAQYELELLIQQIRVLRRQLADVTNRLTAALDALEAAAEEPAESGRAGDIAVLRSLPGVGDKSAASLVAEAPRQLRERNYRHLRLLAGTAPVTIRTGKRQPMVVMRRACNNRLRHVMHVVAFNSLRDRRFRLIYDRQRARGHTHSRALRKVADSMLRVLCACLKNGTLYEPLMT